MKLFLYFAFLQCLICACMSSNQEKTERITTIDQIPEEEIYIKEGFDLQGHRGARGLLPENSIPSFLKAVELGVNTVEMDVVVSKDKKIIVSHEPFFSASICLDAKGDTISDKKEKEYNIFNYTVAEIQQFDCGSIGNKRFPEQQKIRVVKPTLKESIQAVEKYVVEKGLKPVFYNIETKSSPEGDSIFHPKPNEFTKLLYQELKELDILERVFIQSFDVRTLQEFKKIDEEIPLVLLVENTLPLEENLRKLGFTPSIYSPMYQRLSEKEIKKAHELGMKVIPWTINDIADMKRYQRMGIDGLITDYPNRFKQLEKEGNQ